jgi:porin-like protein
MLPASSILRYAGGMVNFVALTTAVTFGALAAVTANAQTIAPTLLAPAPPPKSSRAVPAKPAPVARAIPCSSLYGEGFVNVAGSDTCVRIGGYVRTDAGVTLR